MTHVQSQGLKAVVLLITALIATISPLPASAQSITFDRLLAEATDLDRLAEFPDPAYLTKQFSSYDRRSTTPRDATDAGWFANDDRGHFVRVEQNAGREEFVMMDAAGPGAVVRIWSANPAGTLRIYLDGSETPVIEADMTQLLGGEGSVPMPIAGVRGRGYNLYLPIPYAKHCKITNDAGGIYYLVGYRVYPDATAVETFTAEDLGKPEITAVAQALATPAAQGVPADRRQNFKLTVAGNGTAGIDVQAQANGSTITELVLQPAVSEDDDIEAAVRGVVMRVTFDGDQTIEVPLGDFFGSAPGILPYDSLPFSVNAAGEMTCRWVMPFKKSAQIEFTNFGEATVALTGHVSVAQRPWTERTMYFHAGYRSAYDVPMRPRSHRNHLTATGQGVFVGTSLAVDNPVKAWWGEGDELIYVDGEDFPSWFGTGSEDYFGYAWCDTAIFDHAYHAQPRADLPNNYGRVSNNRFHIIDRIPFNSSFRFDMERWHWVDTSMNEALVSYWYMMPGGEDDFEALDVDDLVVRPMPAWLPPPTVEGAIEGEQMRVASKPEKTTASPQAHDAAMSRGELLWWRSPADGDELVLEFDLPEGRAAGRYKVVARFITASDYGRFNVWINGTQYSEELDLFRPDGVVARELLEIGEVDLKATGNTVNVVVVGHHPDASPSRMFGLDYLLLESLDD